MELRRYSTVTVIEEPPSAESLCSPGVASSGIRAVALHAFIMHQMVPINCSSKYRWNCLEPSMYPPVISIYPPVPVTVIWLPGDAGCGATVVNCGG